MDVGYCLPSGWRLESDAFGVEADVDAFGFEDFLDGCGDVFIFVLDEARAFFNDGDLAAEAAEDLGEFQADIAAAYDDQVLRQLFEVEDGGVDEIGDLVDAGHVGNVRAAAYVDEDFFGRDCFCPGLDFVAGKKAGLFVEDGAVFHAAKPALDTVAGFGKDRPFAGFDGFQSTWIGPEIWTPKSAARRAMWAA